MTRAVRLAVRTEPLAAAHDETFRDMFDHARTVICRADEEPRRL